ncbi:hypothetical protein DFH09DRAFT_1153104 [Mycena vulgaris]|nr:hypothetical protein DFH09DRAFT_1153104 [Mycena vulgaris]
MRAALTVVPLVPLSLSSTISYKSTISSACCKFNLPGSPSDIVLLPRWASLPSALSPCTTTCITGAAANSACLITTNMTCICTDTDFQGQFNTCLLGQCLASEMQVALGLLGSECATASRSAAAASPTRENLPSTSISTGPSPSTSLPGAASPTPVDVSPGSSIGSFGSSTASLAVVAAQITFTDGAVQTTPATEITLSSSAIAASPTAAPSILTASVSTVPFRQPSTAADISPVSAADTSPSTAANDPATNGGSASIRGIATWILLAAMTLAGLISL